MSNTSQGRSSNIPGIPSTKNNSTTQPKDSQLCASRVMCILFDTHPRVRVGAVEPATQRPKHCMSHLQPRCTARETAGSSYCPSRNCQRGYPRAAGDLVRGVFLAGVRKKLSEYLFSIPRRTMAAPS
ncbi:uncharacterized protein H6S33_002989 [Morchella sextelata]|uniref:uncharacterized protein n=1 Tax=Morchella sextelata TaxID=1174677 RepID=UPI001D03D788|nr:uncharacterized protein H6S33_002989 [Morchella sextelata]KAH0607001.1 hypothetical protein H6S33_002989 [Morchella sextelata]